jgi:hypothetical protein
LDVWRPVTTIEAVQNPAVPSAIRARGKQFGGPPRGVPSQ